MEWQDEEDYFSLQKTLRFLESFLLRAVDENANANPI